MEYTVAELEQERWKPIFGYDGLYEVSDLGRVRSKKYGKVRVLRPGKTGGGYFTVNLCKDGKHNTTYIHRLVAQAFIENTDETKTLINHRNECKSDNRVSNIEWCTASYNLSYNGLRKRQYHPKPIRDKVKDLYNPNLTYEQNIEIFRENRIDCSKKTLYLIRKDLGLTKNNSNK